jgi:hypothetical protein
MASFGGTMFHVVGQSRNKRNIFVLDTDGYEYNFTINKQKKYNYLDYIDQSFNILYSISYKQIFKPFNKYKYDDGWKALIRYVQDNIDKDVSLSEEERIFKFLIDVGDDINQYIDSEMIDDNRIKFDNRTIILEIQDMLEQHKRNAEKLINVGLNPKITKTLITTKVFDKIVKCPFLVPEIPLNQCTTILKYFKGCTNTTLINIFKIIGAFIRVLSYDKLYNVRYNSHLRLREILTDENDKYFDILESIPNCGIIAINVARHPHYICLLKLVNSLTGKHDLKSIIDFKSANTHSINQYGVGIEVYEHNYLTTYLIMRKDYGNREIIVDKLYKLFNYTYRCYIDCTSDELCDEQQIGLDKIKDSPLSITLGPAGSGKSSLMGKVGGSKCKQEILTPTGAAAVRANDIANYGATTAHRYYYRNKYNSGMHNVTKNLIFDEISMVDINLMANVLRVTPDLKSLHVFGDENQLPPVKHGHLLHEIIKSSIIDDRIYRLKHNHRSKCTGLNEVQAGIIKDGKFRRPAELIYNSGHEHIEPNDVNKIYSQICNTHTEWSDYIVIGCKNECDQHKNVKGRECYHCVNGLNNIVSKIYRKKVSNIKRFGKPIGIAGQLGIGFAYGDLCHGDIIRYKKNKYDYAAKLFDNDIWIDRIYNFVNGQRVELINVNSEGGRIYITIRDDNGREIKYKHQENIEFSLGFASTIYKVQGAEFKEIICGFTGYYMDKNKIYTSITRAKTKIYSYGINEEYITEESKHPDDILHLMLIDKFRCKNIGEIEIPCDHQKKEVQVSTKSDDTNKTSNVVALGETKELSKTEGKEPIDDIKQNNTRDGGIFDKMYKAERICSGPQNNSIQKINQQDNITDVLSSDDEVKKECISVKTEETSKVLEKKIDNICEFCGGLKTDNHKNTCKGGMFPNNKDHKYYLGNYREALSNKAWCSEHIDKYPDGKFAKWYSYVNS